MKEIQITRYGLYFQSSYYKMDRKPCNLENAIFAGIKPREEIWEMLNIFSQVFAEATTFLMPSCQCYQYNLLHKSSTRCNNHHINSPARFKVPSRQLHEASWAAVLSFRKESTETIAKVLSYACICSLGSLHSLVMLYLPYILTLCNHQYESRLKFSGF